MKSKDIGKFVLHFSVEGCDHMNFAPKVYFETFSKEGERGAYIQCMMDRGYIFESCYTLDDWKSARSC